MNLACPDPEMLRRLLLGQIPAEELDTIASHVEGCASCIERLHELQTSDPLLEAMQKAANPLCPDDTQIRRWMRQQVAGLADTAIQSGSRADVAAHPVEVTSRYRPLQLHARGGLGEVYLAEDQELNRQVALKRIQERHAVRPESRRRFLIEAELTGRLEHPGVVPVYGLVRGEDGQASYAMRFIRGESLAAALARFHGAKGPEPKNFQSVEFRQLLQRFIVVCNTVGFAHNRGVVHRDLKPANIMLGEYGETLVVDWGLARALENPPSAPAEYQAASGLSDDASRTQTGQVLGTPVYMSPEQAAGEWDKVGPASDIYSLGATLYSVLTGRAPFAGADVEAVLAAVRAGQMIPLAQHTRGIAPPLAAICRKAMSLRPQDRYATALDLATDLEQWLADERVSAWPEPWRVRSARWMRRHRTLVTSILAAGGVALVVLTLATVLLDRARRSEAEAKDLAMTSYLMAHEALRESVDLVAQDPRVKEGPLEDLRQRVLQAEVAFFEKFLALKGDQPEFQFQRGYALLGYGAVTRELGLKQEATDRFMQARVIFRGLAEAFPEEPEYQRRLAMACNYVGAMYQDAALSSEDAIAACQESIEIYHAMLRRGISNADDQAELVMTHSNLGYSYYLMGQWQAAEKEYHAALNNLTSVADADATDSQAIRKWATPFVKLALLYSKMGRNDEAEQVYRNLQTRLNQGDPENPRFEIELVDAKLHLADLLGERDLTPEAEQGIEDAIARCRSLVQRHPKVTEYRQSLARYQHDAATTYTSKFRLEKANRLLQEALTEFLALVEAQPTVPRHRADLATCYASLGQLYHKMNRPNDAEKAFRKALEQFQQLAREHVTIPEYQYGVLKCFQELGGLFDSEGRAVEAEQASAEASKALAEYRELLKRQNVNVDQSLQLGKLLFNVGQAAIQQHQEEAALQRSEEAIALLEAVHSKDAQHVEAQRYLAISYWLRAVALGRLGRHTAALQAIGLAEELADSLGNPHRRTLGMERAAIHARLKRHEKATEEAAAVLADPQADVVNYYDASCVFALASAAVQEQSAELAEQYADRAMTILRTAVTKGYRDFHHMTVDKDLESLRGRQDFQMLTQDHEKAQGPGN